MAAYNKVPWTNTANERMVVSIKPVHASIVAFMVTVPVLSPAGSALNSAHGYERLAPTFLFAFLVALFLSAVVMGLRALQESPQKKESSKVLAVAIVGYVIGLGLLDLGVAVPLLSFAVALIAGVLSGACLPVLGAQWARTMAGSMKTSVVCCAAVALAASFLAWLIALMPASVAALLLWVCSVAGTVPLLKFPNRSEPDLVVSKPSEALSRFFSVTWLPLLGVAAFAFTVTIYVPASLHSVGLSLLGGLGASLVLLGACFWWAKRPFLPWCYRILVPLMGAVFIITGSFPAGTFPREVSFVALYVFYITLALLGCALLLAAVHAQELSAYATIGIGIATAALASLIGFTCTEILGIIDDAGLWVSVQTGTFVAVLLLYLGKTSWQELAVPVEGVDISADGETNDFEAQVGSSAEGAEERSYGGESAFQDALDSRCAALAKEYNLSPREGEILLFLARGFSPAYIAKELVLSVSTVRTHVRNIYRKLGINKREELIHLVDK